MAERDLAVVVPFYNEEVALPTVLNGLFDQQLHQGVSHFFVDNGSTDNSRDVINKFTDIHDGFPIQVIEEPQKATGKAADTGFRAAIDAGYPIVARTDADSWPYPDWSEKMLGYFARTSHLQLLGGGVRALRDSHYRFGDSSINPIAMEIGHFSAVLAHRELIFLKSVAGCNMGTRSNAYEQSGGFPPAAIEESDDDLEYTRRVYRKFGWTAIQLHRDVRVATSMRRVHALGRLRLARFYADPNYRTGNGDIPTDIR